jgi:hypothetical protein
VLAATLFACGSNDDSSTESSPSGLLPDDDCTGTLTGGPHPGPLNCRVRMSYEAEAGASASEPDVTVLTFQGGLKDGAGSFSQNIVFRGRAAVQTYDDLVYEARVGLIKRGTIGSVSFVDSSARGLTSADRASVTITALEPDPSVPSVNRVSGSAEWDLRYVSSSMVDATITITFEKQ